MHQLTTKHLAGVLGISKQNAMRLVRAGCLPYQDSPLGRLYDTSDVVRLVRERRKRSETDRRIPRPPVDDRTLAAWERAAAKVELGEALALVRHAEECVERGDVTAETRDEAVRFIGRVLAERLAPGQVAAFVEIANDTTTKVEMAQLSASVRDSRVRA